MAGSDASVPIATSMRQIYQLIFFDFPEPFPVAFLLRKRQK
ncbi:hypothetical protein [Azospirillum palustre]